MANTKRKRKRKTRYRNERQQVTVTTRFIWGRRPMTNQEHGIPAPSLVEKDRRLPWPKSHKQFHSKSTTKQKKPKNKTILWTVWSVYFVDHGYEVSSLNRKKKEKKKFFFFLINTQINFINLNFDSIVLHHYALGIE